MRFGYLVKMTGQRNVEIAEEAHIRGFSDLREYLSRGQGPNQSNHNSTPTSPRDDIRWMAKVINRILKTYKVLQRYMQ
jgi:hypothetical protein